MVKDDDLIIKDKYTIGEISKISGLSVKSLRFYDERGLFKPIQKDTSSGYRYYSESQIPTALLLNELKIKGFTFTDMQTRLQPYSMYSIESNLEAKMRQTQEGILNLQSLLVWLQSEYHAFKYAFQALEESNKKADSDGVEFRMFPKVKALYTRKTSKIGNREIYWDRIAELLRLRDQNGLQCNGPFIGMVHDHYLDYYIFEESDYELLLPIGDTNFEASFVKSFGDFMVASKVYQGKYIEIVPVATRLFNVIEKSGYQITGPLIREYLLDFTYGIINDTPITRLSFPIKKK